MENLEKLFTEDEVKELVRDRIRERVNELFYGIVEAKLRDSVTSMVDKEVEKIVKESLKGSIHTDDGWGDKKDYDSLEDMFKKQLKTSIESSYSVKAAVERTMKKAVEDLVAINAQALGKKLLEEIKIPSVRT